MTKQTVLPFKLSVVRSGFCMNKTVKKIQKSKFFA